MILETCVATRIKIFSSRVFKSFILERKGRLARKMFVNFPFMQVHRALHRRHWLSCRPAVLPSLQNNIGFTSSEFHLKPYLQTSLCLSSSRRALEECVLGCSRDQRFGHLCPRSCFQSYRAVPGGVSDRLMRIVVSASEHLRCPGMPHLSGSLLILVSLLSTSLSFWFW